MSQAIQGTIVQTGYLVPDVKVGMQTWVDSLGVGPWLEVRDVHLTGTLDGKPAEVTFHVGMAYQDEMQIELIQVISPAPSPYHHADGTPIHGQHHIAWLVEDLDAAVEEATGRGLRLRFRGGNAATEVAYLDVPDVPGTWFEFILGPQMRQMLDAGIAETRTWDGTDPIRTRHI